MDLLGAAVLRFRWNVFTGKSATTPAAAPANVSWPAGVGFDTDAIARRVEIVEQ